MSKKTPKNGRFVFWTFCVLSLKLFLFRVLLLSHCLVSDIFGGIISKVVKKRVFSLFSAKKEFFLKKKLGMFRKIINFADDSTDCGVL